MTVRPLSPLLSRSLMLFVLTGTVVLLRAEADLPPIPGRRFDAGARAFADSAMAHRDTDPARAIGYARMAVEKARRASDLHSLHDALDAACHAHHMRAEHEQLFQTASEALRVAGELRDERCIGIDMGWISLALTDLRQPAKAHQYALRSVEHLRASGDRKALADGLNRLGRSCVPVGRTAEALLCVSEASALRLELGDTLGAARDQLLKGWMLTQQGRWSDALPVLLGADRTLRTWGTPQDRCRVLRDVAATYGALGHWGQAAPHLAMAEDLAWRNGLRTERPALMDLRIRMLESGGRTAEALAVARHLIALNDSLLHQEVCGRIATSMAMHETGARREEMEGLKARNAELEHTISEGRSRGRWWLGLIALLVLVALVALRGLRFNRRAKRLVRVQLDRIRDLNEQLRQARIELQRQQARLTESMLNDEEKELRLKEVHHRVKNNLQVVNTLLRMQALHLGDPRLDEAFREAQGRVLSMALVHEHIYKVGDLSRVNVKAHVLALAEGVLASHGLRDRVRLDLRITMERASVETLIPLSLLLNELLTNAAKHAFTGRDQGMLRVDIRRLPDGRCELTFSDDGHGMPHERLFEGHSFGMELIRTLTEQLDGSIRLLKGEGTTFELTFVGDRERLRAAS